MIITLDGPAGAGKSSAAKLLARRLGFRFLDTGAMYRAVALAAVRKNLDWNQPELLADLARQIKIELPEGRVLLDGEDVSQAIRTAQITAITYHAANNPEVRAHLVMLQRQAAGIDDIVTEGRDQGTVVFPDAQCKIFLTASAQERARRRQIDLEARGEHIPLEEVLEQQNLRDARDSDRAVGPLIPAWDSTIVCTDGMTTEKVVEHLEMLVRNRVSRQ